MTKKLLCFVFLTVSIFANAQNRYDTPANATFTNTYVPMTHEEMMLRAAAEVYREKRAREDFDKYSRTAYEYLQKKQTSNPQLSSSASFLRLNVLSSLN